MGRQQRGPADPPAGRRQGAFAFSLGAAALAALATFFWHGWPNAGYAAADCPPSSGTNLAPLVVPVLVAVVAVVFRHCRARRWYVSACLGVATACSATVLSTFAFIISAPSGCWG